MAVDKMFAHRASALKQTNKPHKHGRHRSKGSISIATKGKVNLKELSKKKQSEQKKQQQRHQALQLRRNKRDEVLTQKRSIGGLSNAPFLISVIPLNDLLNVETAIALLTKCDNEAIVKRSLSGVVHITLPRFKQHFSIVIPPRDNFLANLDALKVSDTVLLLVSANAGIGFGDEMVDKNGRKILATALAQGLPTPVIALTDLEQLPVKKQSEQKHAVHKLMSKWFPDEKAMALATEADALNVLRRIGSQKRKRVLYREQRSYVLAESYQYEPDADGYKGTLKVAGYIRGRALSVNSLVYIPGLGAYQMSRIEAPCDPFAWDKSKRKEPDATQQEQTGAMETVRVLAVADDKQESLESENVPDPMDGEQTWPTEEELKMAAGERKRLVKKVPKGWSDYQAAWIPDEDAEDDSDADTVNSEDEADNDGMDAASEEVSESENDFDIVTVSEVCANDQQYDQEMDFNAEEQDLAKLQAAKMDQMFPDEIDTPLDTPARVRFVKYRGLESFRTSPWDPKENLPLDYARIFQFENFEHTKRRLLKQKEKQEDGAMPGWFVTIYVCGVPKYAWSAFLTTGSPLIIVGMHPHENKMSVANVVLKRTSTYDQPIASKERLIFQCGYRRFAVNPIFSQHTNGRKHKYERFFQADSPVVASFFAPIQFPPAPVLCFKEVNNRLELVATGNLLSCNPDRIVAKRIVLSGHPLRVHKRSAVIRFMFFNREDILYFKPCKLRTRCGQVGHIKEPLGTHGHMKCVFDAQLKSQDTVFLHLYKRVFPKWDYEECITSVSEGNENMQI